ncbi:MAG TPA: XdhC/CoxI family protein [Thermoplasmata archaeon]|nr:XdhC/CoxI family protein [Thermoplasmata archaeon]
MDRKTAREALRLLEHHRAFVKATVVRATGSVPGKLGATMIVRADGTTLGTVGGASLEEEVKRLAARAIEGRAGDLLHFDLAAWKRGGLASLCGGSVDIALEFVPARPNLLLWGGGHVAEAVARLLPALEFDHSVADDRPEYVGRDRFPDADRREVVTPGHLFETFEPAEFTHLYLLGYDALRDLEVLAEAIDRFPNTIGLIASASKREHLYARLRERGVDRGTLGRIRSPIGVEIGAQSPAEIAVSIVAEVVRDVHPPSLRTPERAAPSPSAATDVGRRPR